MMSLHNCLKWQLCLLRIGLKEVASITLKKIIKSVLSIDAAFLWDGPEKFSIASTVVRHLRGH
jgi:hypothetical protein